MNEPRKIVQTLLTELDVAGVSLADGTPPAGQTRPLLRAVAYRPPVELWECGFVIPPDREPLKWHGPRVEDLPDLAAQWAELLERLAAAPGGAAIAAGLHERRNAVIGLAVHLPLFTAEQLAAAPTGGPGAAELVSASAGLLIEHFRKGRFADRDYSVPSLAAWAPVFAAAAKQAIDQLAEFIRRAGAALGIKAARRRRGLRVPSAAEPRPAAGGGLKRPSISEDDLAAQLDARRAGRLRRKHVLAVFRAWAEPNARIVRQIKGDAEAGEKVPLSPSAISKVRRQIVDIGRKWIEGQAAAIQERAAAAAKQAMDGAGLTSEQRRRWQSDIESDAKVAILGGEDPYTSARACIRHLRNAARPAGQLTGGRARGGEAADGGGD